MQHVDGTRRSPRLLRLILPIAISLAMLLTAVTYLQPSLLPALSGGTDSAAVRAQGPGGGSATNPGPADAVRRAWERAQAAGSYHVAVGIRQTAIPKPVPANIGQHEQSLTLSAEGDVRLPGFARLSMRLEDAGSSAQPVTVVQEGNQTFLEKDGKREPVQSPAGFASPTMDFMAFLAGVENVQPADPTASGQEPLTSYTFDVSGSRFARYLSDRVRAQLTEELGQAPEVQTSPTLARMTGRGQLWVDANGLPRREVLDLTMPDVSDQYDGKAHLEVMFSQFGPLPAASAAGGSSTVAGAIGSAASSVAALAKAAAPSGAVLTLALALVACLIVSYRRRLVYKVFAISIVLIMVSTPVLHDFKVARVLNGYAEAAAAPSALMAAGLAGESGAAAQGQATTSEKTAPGASIPTFARDASAAPKSAGPASAAPLAAPAPRQLQQLGPSYSPDQVAACGDGDSSVDSDADGLNDLVESCLGTDPTDPDTDGDGIPDGLEAYGIAVIGADSITRDLTSNPFEGSSAGDGISDAQKWPETDLKLENGRPIVGADGHMVVAGSSDPSATYGLASSWDLDDDKIPNVWDDDIDGDGVPNELDLSPSDRTAFVSQLDLSTQGAGYTGYENIDVQVRPENPDHMQAPTTVFDWPLDDDKGQIQHLRQANNYTDSMRLVLMLQVDTNVAPPAALAHDAGIVIQQPSNPSDPNKPYRLLVPMNPNTIDGKPYAFSARVTYGGSGAVPDVQWTAKLIWLLVGKTDSYYDCSNPASPSATSCKVRTDTMLANVYDETFRVTGLNVTKSGSQEVAVFGTPNSAENPKIEHEDGMLYQLYVGLETIFQGYERLAVQNGTMLHELEQRFNNPNTNQELQWGLANTVKVSREAYVNGDFALTGSADQVRRFLDNNYHPGTGPFCQDGTGQTFNCASLIVATESHEGFAGLGDFQAQSAGSTLRLSASLANVPVATYRSVRLSMYEHRAAGWAAMDPARMFSVLAERYEDKLPEILTRVQGAQPNLTPDYLRFGLFFAYARASGGGTSTIKLDEQMLKPAVAASEGQLLTELGLWAPGDTTPLPSNYQPKNIIDFANWELQGFFSDINPAPATAYGASGQLTQVASGAIGDALRGATTTGGFSSWMGGKLTAAAKWAKANPGQAGNLALKAALVAANTILSTISYFCVDKDGNSTCKGVDPQAMQVAGKVITGVSIARQIYETSMSIKDAVSTSAKAAQAAAQGLSKVAVVGAVVGVVLSVGMTAYATWAAVKNLDTHSPIFGIIIAQAVISVLLNVLFTVLSFIPVVNILASIFQIIDAILGFILGFFGIDFSMTSWIIFSLCALFYQPLLLTKLESQSFAGMSAGPPPNQTSAGLVEGAHYQITDRFSATLRTTDELVLGPPANITAGGALYHGSTSDLDKSWAEATYSASSTDDAAAALLNSARNCTNITDDVRRCTNDVGVDFTLQRAKRNVDLTFQVTTYATTVYAVCGLGGLLCGNTLAKDNVKSSTSVWPDPENPTDSDPEPITLTVDVLPATIDALFVWTEVGRTNTGPTNDPYVSDADGDGLVDAVEARIGTSSDSANGADSDEDDATDGQEVCRWSTTANDNNGGLVGGWDVTLPGAPAVHVCSNPKDADFDDDGQTDGAERANATSPYAANNGPRISLAPSPSASHVFQPPYPTTGVFVPSGTEVTLDLGLLNVTPDPIDGTLSVCLPSFMGSASGGTLTGARNPVRTGPTRADWCESGAGNVYTWYFSPAADNLLVGEVVTTTLKSTATASQSTSGTISLQLDNANKVMTTTYPIRVDVDNPSVAFTFPTAGAVLGGGRSNYVVGGTTSDPTTWVKQVAVTLAGSTTTIDKDSETNPWAVNWTLPADGVYTLSAEATDYVDRTGSSSVQVTVDNTPPTGTISVPGSGFVAPTTGTTVVTIAGTVSDNLSGVARAEVSIDGQPWRHTAFTGEGTHPTSGDWSFPWTIDPSAAGSHRIALRAFDQAGNASSVVTGTLTVDKDAPTHNLTTAPGQVEQGQPFTVYGRANDAGRVALPPRPETLQSGLDNPISANAKATVWLEPEGIADYDGGVSATWLGDVGGDGRADLAVGLPASADGRGRVTVLHGRGGGWPVKPDTEAISSSPTSFVGAPGARIGDIVATAGDVNADGRFDLLVGDPANGRAFLIFGQPGLYGRDVVLDQAQPGTRVLIQAPALGLLAPAGDVNGDGYGDFLVGLGDKVYLMLGAPAGTLPNPLDPTVEAAAVAPLCTACTATGMGDVNGDGKADFVVTGTSAVYLFLGDTGFARRGLWSLTLGDGAHAPVATFTSSDQSPKVVALGDVNGDTPTALADFIFSDGNNPSLVLGRASGSWAGQAFSFDPAASGFLAAPGDVNGDGKADLLLGTSNDRAYLILGAESLGTTPPIQALLSDVAGAASAPYAAGADCNCDRSSDLLLAPPQVGTILQQAAQLSMPRTELDLGPVPHIAAESLPVAESTAPTQGAEASSAGAAALTAGQPSAGLNATAAGSESVQTAALVALAATTRTVDDDGCAGCYTSIQGAVDAASPGDTIYVKPGAYPIFEVVGSAQYPKDNLTIRGADPDAVIILGSGRPNAVRIAGAVGVHLTGMTLRNAHSAVRLEGAGVGGATDSTKVTELDHLVLYGFTHALSMDRTSTVNFHDVTTNGDTNTEPQIDVDSTPDPAYAPTWQQLGDIPASVGSGGSIVYSGSTIMALPSGASTSVSVMSGSWRNITGGPATLAHGPHLLAGSDSTYGHILRGNTMGRTDDEFAKVHALATVGSGLFVAGESLHRVYAPGSTSATSVREIARWDMVTEEWSALGSGLTEELTDCGGYARVYAMAASGADLYVGGCFPSAGGTTARNIARWNTTTNTWHTLGNGLNGGVFALAVVGSDLYVGGFFNRAYNPGGGEVAVRNVAKWNGSTWSALGGTPTSPGGPGNVVYALKATQSGGVLSSLFVGSGSGYPVAGGAVDMWNGTWMQYGTFNGIVRALEVAGTKVYAGGDFTTAGGQAANHIARWDGPGYGDGTWSALGSGVNGSVAAIQGVVRSADSDLLYVGGTFTDQGQLIAGWDLDANRWMNVGNLQGGQYVTPAGVNTLAVVGATDGDLYFGGVFASTDTSGPNKVVGVGRLVTSWLVAPGAGTWRPWKVTSGTLAHMLGDNAAATTNGNREMYVLAGGGSQGFYKYVATDNLSGSWSSIGTGGWTPGAGASLAWDGTSIYALQGGTSRIISLFNTQTNAWSTLTTLPTACPALANGASLTVGGGYLYVVPGGGSQAFYRYSIAGGTWAAGPLVGPATGVRSGGWLARLSDGNIYAAMGGDSGTFHRFVQPSATQTPQKLTVSDVAFVSKSATPTWLSSITSATWAGAPAEDFALNTSASTGNQWVGASAAAWSPTTPLNPAGAWMSLAAAKFVDTSYSFPVFRVQAGSALTAGYYSYHADAHVSPSYGLGKPNDGYVWGDTAFSSIQAAIDSGAQHVYLAPGIYPQPFYLVNGVQVAGSGADATIVQSGGGTLNGALVLAEGITRARVSRLTILGASQVTGLRAEQGAQFTLSRSIIRGAPWGILMEGSNTHVEIVNDDIVGNRYGITADSYARVDVRNSVLAFNSEVGLKYATRPYQDPILHTYNAYFANGTPGNYAEGDILVDAGPARAADGPGEIGVDPAFTNPALNDYRPLPGSPLVDAGNPSDPAPPGTGGRVDIGYVESSQASFYADKRFCATCDNFGLTWQVDAFDTIQAAVTAAQRAAAGINSPTVFTVGVGPGIYQEKVTIPSYVRLVGSGAEATTLQGNGSGSALTIDGATGVEVRGLKVTGSGTGADDAGILITGAANGVTVTRNIVTGNQIGISVAGGASDVRVDFNTVVSNNGAGLRADGAGSWANVRNSIFSNNPVGMQAQNVGQLFADYNLMNNTTDYLGATVGEANKTGAPQFDTAYSGEYRLLRASPAVDSADPTADPVSGGGRRADIGYRELLAAPLSLLFGREGISCAFGNSGVARVEVGLVGPLTTDQIDQAVTATEPSTWSTAALQGSSGDTARYWSATFTPTSGGTYRLYARSTDSVGNLEPEKDWFVSNVEVVGVPQVAWVDPAADTSTDQAAIEVIAQATDYVNPTTGQRVPARTAAFEVGGASYAADWLDGPDTQPRRFRAVVPLAVVDGSQEIVAVAVDSAGVDGRTSRTVTTTTPNDVATIAAPLPNGATNSPNLTVFGYARFKTTTGAHSVTVQVDGGSAVSATLANPSAQFSAWTATVTLPDVEGSHSLTATASGSTAMVAPAATGGFGLASPDQTKIASPLADPVPITLTYDRTGPTVSVVSPAVGGVIKDPTFRAEIDASDSGSGVAAVEVSQDGGSTWHYAGYDSSTQHYTVTLSAINPADYVSQRLTVRARDKASNQTIVYQTVIFDNIPPQPLAPTFSIPLGSHLNQPTSVEVRWPASVDASGSVTVVGVVDTIADTTPDSSAPTVTSGFSASLSGPGDWYVHLQAWDTAGNSVTQSYGPWHVDNRDATSVACADRRVSIAVDGSLDTASGVAAEWRADRELLDYDVRSGRVQALYATWDADALYLGWRGAQWAADGTLWAYVQSSGSSGSTQAVPGQNVTPTLPFAANYAVRIDSQSKGTLWQHTGGSWVEQGGDAWSFRHLGQDTEIRLPWTLTAASNLRLLAFAVDDKGQAWSVFPTTNPLDGAWADSYGASTSGSWDDPCSVTVPNAGQPQARYVTMSVTSPQDPGKPWSPGSQLGYAVKLTNLDPRTLADATLQIEAPNALSFSGLTCLSGQSGQVCTEELDDLAAGATLTITRTATLAPDLSGQSAVTAKLSLLLSGQSAPLGQATITHRVDGTPPTVALGTTMLRAGTQTVVGSADDGDGSGIDVVKLTAVRAGITSPQTVSGTANWSLGLTVPLEVNSVDVTVEATDRNGLVTSKDYQLPVDTAPPTVTLSVPATTAGPRVEVAGTASEGSAPASGVKLVEVQVDGDTAPWKPATGPFPCASGECWTFGWDAPGENGTSHKFRARATDAVGNVSQPTDADWQSTTVYATATDLAIAMTGQVSLSPSPVITYTITATNKGPNAVWGAVVSDTFPSSIASASWQCTSATTGSNCQAGVTGIGDLSRQVILAVGGSATFTVTANVAAGATGPITNTVQVALPVGVPDLDSTNNQQTLETSLNAAPTVEAGEDVAGDEGSAITIVGSFVDPNEGDSWTATVNYGDGSGAQPLTLSGKTFALTHTYADDSATAYVVTVTVTDSSGAWGADNASVTVRNVAPTATFAATSPIDEGNSSSLSFTGASDPSTADTSAGFRYAFACDGLDASLATTYANAATDSTASCQLGESGSFTVMGRIFDKNDGYNTYSATVTVGNVAPTASFTATSPIDEGNASALSLSSPFDPSSGDTTAGFHYAFSCTNGDLSAATYASGSTTSTSTDCTFDDNGLYSVKGRIIDREDGFSEYTASVTVNNVAPTASIVGAPTSSPEGTAISLTASATDPGSADTAAGFTYAWSVTRNGNPYSSGSGASFSFTPDDSGTYVVSLSATDKDAGVGNTTATIAVDNVDPTVTPPSDQMADEGTSKSFDLGSFGDPGADSPWAVDVDWGDDTAHTAFEMTAQGAITSRPHTYLDGPNTYNVTVTVTDKDGGLDSKTFTVTVNNVAPTVAFVAPTTLVDEGSTVTYNFTVSDTGLDTFTAKSGFPDCGTGGSYVTGTLSATGSYGSFQCFFPDGPATPTVRLQVTDSDGADSNVASVTVAIGNVAPAVNASPASQTKQYSDPIDSVTITATDVAADSSLALKSYRWKKDSGEFTPTDGLPTGLAFASTSPTCATSGGLATCRWSITGNAVVAQGTYVVRVTIADDTTESYTDIAIIVGREDARVTYTGALVASTASATSGKATVTLAATVQDITAVDPAGDAYAGDIRNATVTFVDRDKGNALLCTASVGLVTIGDTKTGTATCNWSADIANADSIEYTIGIIVGGDYYARDASLDNTVVNVYKPLSTNFITGGGYLVLSGSAGLKAGDDGSRTNFGFGVKYNKAGNKLQGNINIIVRRTEADGILHVYQIKGNAMTSLLANKPNLGQATFNGKASIQDITDPLNPISVEGNATLQVVMTDKGEHGTSDTIGITVWNKAGGLWLSTSWDGKQTVQQTLGGGNLIIR